MEFNGKVALITGGSRGIGRETAIALARAGAKLAIGSRNNIEGEQFVNSLISDGYEALYRQTDVTDPVQLEALVNTTVDTYGRLDVAFNNAGIHSDMGPLHELSPESCSKVLNINVLGIFNAMKFEIGAMLKSGQGAIVNTTSILGIRGLPNMSTYVASKHAVIGLTRSAALDYAQQNIRINAIAPGPIETEMLKSVSGGDLSKFNPAVPMGRIGQPQEIADAVLWLLYEGNQYITGEVLSVDGGWCAK